MTHESEGNYAHRRENVWLKELVRVGWLWTIKFSSLIWFHSGSRATPENLFFLLCFHPLTRSHNRHWIIYKWQREVSAERTLNWISNVRKLIFLCEFSIEKVRLCSLTWWNWFWPGARHSCIDKGELSRTEEATKEKKKREMRVNWWIDFDWNAAPLQEATLTSVTRKTRKNRTVPIDVPSDGIKRTRTFDNVSPTTVLYEIIAVNKFGLIFHFRRECGVCATTYPKKDREIAGTRENNIHSCQMHSPSRSRSYDVPTSAPFWSVAQIERNVWEIKVAHLLLLSFSFNIIFIVVVVSP